MNVLNFKRQSSVVTCERCGLELTDPESIARGMGEECAISASAQFTMVSSLTMVLATTDYFDDIARKHLILKHIVESRLATAKSERNPAKIIKFTKELKRLTGILVRRELARQARSQQRQVA